MKCPSCQKENPANATRCRDCGQALDPRRGEPATRGKSGAAGPAHISHENVAKKLKLDYMYGVREEIDRMLESFQDFCETLRDPKLGKKELLDLAAKFLHGQFHIREISMGLRSSSDGLLRYVTMRGMRAQVWAKHQGLSYAEEQFYDNEKYKGTQISKYTKLFLAEDYPYDDAEKETYSEHLMAASSRKSLCDSIEGDYIDTVFFGPDDKILGWMECSGTWENKLPDARTIRYMELIACLLGLVLSHKEP